MSQKEHSKANQKAWSHKSYEATVLLDGTPEEAAEKQLKNPEYTLRAYLDFLGNVKEKKIANLLGSTGKRAVALSLLGAQVTVVDITPEQKRYALEFAQAAGVSFAYIVSDVLKWDTEPFLDHFDIVLMELGILHYFVDLNPLAKLIHDILTPGGKMILHESHPMIQKYKRQKAGDQVTLTGDYFADEIIEKPAPRASVAYSEAEIRDFPKCRYKYWQLGEIISAFCANNLIIETLQENPHLEFTTLPGTFTLVAKK